MSRLTNDKRLDTLLRDYMGRGWKLENRGKHYMLKAPKGGGVTVPRTPSDHRSFLNIRAQLRRTERAAH